MKKHILIPLFLAVTALLFFYSCEDKNEGDNEENLYKNTVWEEVEDANFDITGAHKEGERVAIKLNSNDRPSEIFYRATNDAEPFYLWLEDGLPKKAYINGNFILFSNITSGSFDAGIVRENGDTEVLRDLEYDFPPELLQKSLAGDALYWSGIVLDVGLCATSITGTAYTMGALAPFAAASCGGLLTSVMVGVTTDSDEEAVAATTTISSVTGFSIGGILSTAGSITNIATEDAEENQTELNNTWENLEQSNAITYDNFGITDQEYDPTVDWNATVEDVFGSEYKAADWTDLKEYYENNGSQDLIDLMDNLNITEDNKNAFVYRNGDKKYSSDRWYFMSRHNHDLPSHYLSHDNIDNNLIDLGSWDGDHRILAIKKNK
jgi:hypothetical protein